MPRQETKKYSLTISDSDDGRTIKSVKFTGTTALVTGITVLVVAAALFFALIAWTPLRTLIPGYPNASTEREAVQNVIKLDSLERVIGRWELYSENLKRIVNGEEPLKVDSILQSRIDGKTVETDPAAAAKSDSILKAEVTAESKFDIRSNEKRSLPIEGMLFFTPIKGVVSKPFDKVMHPCIEITAPDNSLVKSILEGTVISDGWSSEGGYTIHIQHAGDIVSIYRHNLKILVRTGDKVNAGTPIGIVGKDGDGTGDGRLVLELWNNGEAADPARFINF